MWTSLLGSHIVFAPILDEDKPTSAIIPAGGGLIMLGPKSFRLEATIGPAMLDTFADTVKYAYYQEYQAVMLIYESIHLTRLICEELYGPYDSYRLVVTASGSLPFENGDNYLYALDPLGKGTPPPPKSLYRGLL
jgi:hypothetical protein